MMHCYINMHAAWLSVLLVMLLIMLPNSAHAGAWAFPAGEGQVISTTVHDTAKKAYDDKWKLTRDVSFSKTDTQIYIEHGLTDKITLVGQTALQDVDYTAREGRTQVQGFGNSALGARYQVFKTDKHAGSLQAKFILAGSGENISDADLGRGGNGIELRGLYGRNFKIGTRNGFMDIQAGWISRSDPSPDSFKGDVTLGIGLTPQLQVLAQTFYSQTGSQVIGADRVLSNESIKIQASIVLHRTKKRSYQLGAFQTVAGRNIIKEKAIIVGLWQRY